jgi:uncharacterized protein (DUF1919 family)
MVTVVQHSTKGLKMAKQALLMKVVLRTSTTEVIIRKMEAMNYENKQARNHKYCS